MNNHVAPPTRKRLDLSLKIQIVMAVSLIALAVLVAWATATGRARYAEVQEAQDNRIYDLTLVEICVTASILSLPIEERDPEHSSDIIAQCIASAPGGVLPRLDQLVPHISTPGE